MAVGRLAKATGSLSFRVLPNEIRKRFNGTCNYTGRDTTEKWVYKKMVVTNTVATMFTTGDEFLGISSSDDLATSDNVQFIMLKNTGFTSATESATNNVGILITFGGVDITPDLGPDDPQTAIFLNTGDTIALKVPASEADDWRVISCQVSGGIPSLAGQSGDEVLLEIAAIIDDGG